MREEVTEAKLTPKKNAFFYFFLFLSEAENFIKFNNLENVDVAISAKKEVAGQYFGRLQVTKKSFTKLF